jgi:hypothetical protein
MKYDIETLLAEGFGDVSPDEIGFETDAVLIYDKSIRKQKYVLNSLREIAGVRIVTVISPTQPQGENQAVGIRIKYTPDRKQPLLSYNTFLKRNILTTKGVEQVRFFDTKKVKL